MERAGRGGDPRQRAWSLSILARAHFHRGRLGDRSALTTARMLAADIDNPALTPLLDGHG